MDLLKEEYGQWDIKPCLNLLNVSGEGPWEPHLQGEWVHIVRPQV